MKYDLAIIGGGPAAIAGAVYSARKRLSTVLIASEIGGQSSVSNEIYNWIGTPAISGTELANSLKKHAEEYTKEAHTLKMEIGSTVESFTKDGEDFVVKTNKGEVRAKAVLIASGSRRRKLEIPGAEEFENKGVVYCATCDGPLFSGMNVAVVGGGNAAFEAVLQLSEYCTSVTLLQRGDAFRADEISVEKAKSMKNVILKKNVELVEIKGDKFVNSISYKESGGEIIELPVGGIFVEIGQLPNTDLAKDLVKLDKYNKVVVDPMNQRTSVEGVWSAGDCTDGLYHQNNIAAGDAVKAIEDLYIWIKTRK